MAFSDLTDTLAMLTVSLDGEVIQDQRIAADVLAFRPGAPHAGAHPLDNQVAFEFGDCTDDDHDGPAQRAAGIDIFRKLTYSIWRRFNSSRTSRKCFTDRAIRSEAQTRTTSNRPRRASVIMASSPGRLAFTPEIRSVYSCTISRPRWAAIWRRSRSCVSGCWSTVLTLIERAARVMRAALSSPLSEHAVEVG